MKYAIISDIHSNPKALEVVLEDAWDKGADKIICLGDVVGYGPDPAGAIALVRDTCDVVLMGNHDAAVAGARNTDGMLGSAADGVRRNRAQLSKEDLNWLASLSGCCSKVTPCAIRRRRLQRSLGWIRCRLARANAKSFYSSLGL